MSVILSFIFLIMCIAGWWLARHHLLSKPWLERGVPASATEGAAPVNRTAKVGLGVFLAVIGALFALLASAYFERMGLPDWRDFPLPRLLWVNTGMLIACSAALHCALADARNGALKPARSGLVIASLAGLAFVFGQLAVWLQLVSVGLGVASNPAVTFFYLLTGLHGLHILGGLVALAFAVSSAFHGTDLRPLIPRLELCTIYWHFLLVIWLAILVVIAGWAEEIVVTCSQLFS
ncbi:MAG: cytochrome c oxidase subunit 3 [Pseudomonadota bacterium]